MNTKSKKDDYVIIEGPIKIIDIDFEKEKEKEGGKLNGNIQHTRNKR